MNRADYPITRKYQKFEFETGRRPHDNKQGNRTTQHCIIFDCFFRRCTKHVVLSVDCTGMLLVCILLVHFCMKHIFVINLIQNEICIYLQSTFTFRNASSLQSNKCKLILAVILNKKIKQKNVIRHSCHILCRSSTCKL